MILDPRISLGLQLVHLAPLWIDTVLKVMQVERYTHPIFRGRFWVMCLQQEVLLMQLSGWRGRFWLLGGWLLLWGKYWIFVSLCQCYLCMFSMTMRIWMFCLITVYRPAAFFWVSLPFCHFNATFCFFYWRSIFLCSYWPNMCMWKKNKQKCVCREGGTLLYFLLWICGVLTGFSIYSFCIVQFLIMG